MLNVVVDTNVLISGIISPHGFPRKVYEAWKNNNFLLILIPSIKDEIHDVLDRSKIAKRYHLAPKRINSILQALDLYSVEVEDEEPLDLSFPDPKDVKFLSAAKTVKADYLVTGDKELLSLGIYESTRIITPGEFIRILTKEK